MLCGARGSCRKLLSKGAAGQRVVAGAFGWVPGEWGRKPAWKLLEWPGGGGAGLWGRGRLLCGAAGLSPHVPQGLGTSPPLLSACSQQNVSPLRGPVQDGPLPVTDPGRGQLGLRDVVRFLWQRGNGGSCAWALLTIAEKILRENTRAPHLLWVSVGLSVAGRKEDLADLHPLTPTPSLKLLGC